MLFGLVVLMARTDVNTIALVSNTDSNIAHVSLYAALAEVTRIYKPSLIKASNKVVISGLPTVLLEESLRVEGRGPCIIHEVSISEIPTEAPKMTSANLDDLLKAKTQIDKALYRCKKAIDSVNSFQDSFDIRTVQPSALHSARDNVESVLEGLDDQLLDLEGKLEEVDAAIVRERETLGEVKVDTKLRKRVSITVFAEKDCEAEIILTYAVKDATWEAVYDIYVEMNSQDKPVSLIYRAKIVQNTGEAWEDIPLTLETASPVFGVSIPKLTPWTLSVYQPYLVAVKRKKKSRALSFSLGGPGGGGEMRQSSRREGHVSSYESEDDDAEGSLMGTRGLLVSSKGDINATFSIPGLITVPSDGASHAVTITELALGATMSWVSVPQKAARAYLTAKIINDSEYTFLSGTSSVYVDGSFISRSDVPAVSPQEGFDCALGVDPSVRITYHPRSKKVKQSGFTSKTTTYLCEQRITVTNTKALAIDNLKVLEQFPVSESSAITVNILNPALAIPQPNKKGEYTKAEPVKISKQVLAQWDHDAEAPEVDLMHLGKDGKFNWQCAIAAQGNLSLALSWEVSCPFGTNIAGFDV